MKRCSGPGCAALFEPTRRDQRFAPGHGACRLRAHRAEVRGGKVALPHRLPEPPEFGAVVQRNPIEGPARLGYLDPVYPGRASLYPEGAEVDHAALIRRAVEVCPDGWALSTASDTLGRVLALCPPGVRVCSWYRGGRPSNERPRAWEPVIVCGGRRTPGPVEDAVIDRGRVKWGLPGGKPPGFYRWLFAFLGAAPGDLWAEPFVGSGTGLRAAEAFGLRLVEFGNTALCA